MVYMQITKTQIKCNKIFCVLQAEMIKILAKAMLFTHITPREFRVITSRGMIVAEAKTVI